MKRLPPGLVAVCLSLAHSHAQEWKPLIDENLSQWKVWTGVPDPSLKIDWPGKANERPMGNGDPLKIYAAEKQPDGSFALKVSGKAPAALTSLKSFSKYHLRAEVKWGEKKWPPSLKSPRDSGIIYHCQGEDGAFWKTWKTGLEYQVQECEFGGYFRIGDVRVEGRLSDPSLRRPRFDPKGYWSTIIAPKYCNRCHVDLEKKNDWNSIELIVSENRSVHIFNGKIVNVIRKFQTRSKEGQWVPLNNGQLQIQSSGTEVTYRRLEMKEIPGMPAEFRKLFRTKP